MKDKVLDAIERGRIIMRPKWHFVLQTVLFATGGGMVLFLLVYIASLVIFVLRQNGEWFVPVFGFSGWREFFISLPWLLILLAFVFILILELLVRRYSFAYRQPLLYSAIGIMVVTIVGGIAVAGTPFHGGLSRYAEKNSLPVVGPFYHTFGMRPLANVHVGEVIEMIDDGFLIRNRRGEHLHIRVTARTRFPLGTDFAEGDGVVVLGKRGDDTVQAFGVRGIDDVFASSTRGPGPRRTFRFLIPR